MEHLLHLIPPSPLRNTTLVTWVSLAVVVGVLTAVVKFLLRQVQLRRVTRQFQSPPTHWLYGNVHQLMAGEAGHYEVLKSIDELNPQVLQLWLGPFFPFAYCCHPDSIKAILSTTEPKAEHFYRFFRPFMGDGLLTSRGSKWHRNRRLLTPAFHFEILKPYVKLFSESTNVLIDKWTNLDSGTSLDMFKDVPLMTLDSILKCSLSTKINCQTDGQSNSYVQAIEYIAQMVKDRAVYPPFQSDLMFFLSPSGRRFRKALAVVHGLSEKIIKERKAQLFKDKEKGMVKTRRAKYLDFLDILLEAKDEDGTGLTDAEIRDEVDTFMSAGHETTASGISWTLYHLAKHPEYQDRCRREAEEVLQGRTEMTWEDLGKLPFITMYIKESMRRRPAVPGVTRELTQALELPDGRKLPSGWTVHVSIMHMHGNPHVWADPEVFDPFRFSPENSKERHPYAFIPFAAGPRNCIGQRFAMAEMKVGVALILQRFDLELDGPPPFFVRHISLRSKTGIWLKIHHRR